MPPQYIINNSQELWFPGTQFVTSSQPAGSFSFIQVYTQENHINCPHYHKHNNNHKCNVIFITKGTVYKIKLCIYDCQWNGWYMFLSFITQNWRHVSYDIFFWRKSMNNVSFWNSDVHSGDSLKTDKLA